MKSLSGADVEGKDVLLRTDLNLPLEDGEPQRSLRFERYLETIEDLSGRGAKVFVLAHQGRPGREDFISLKRHSELVSDSLDRDVGFVRSFFGSELEETIDGMVGGDVVLLENIRFLSEELQNSSPEDHADDIFVDYLSGFFDLYVGDRFSVAHRSHGSIVGFPQVMDSCIGPVMSEELENCSKVREEFSDGILVLGGEKPSDLVPVIEEMIEDVSKVLLGGVPGELALIAEGHDLGDKEDWIRENGFDSEEEKLLELVESYKDKFVLPVDVSTREGVFKVDEDFEAMTWDIGEQTVERFVDEVRDADQVLMKGPLGKFEEHSEGTEKVVDAIADNDGFTVLGGGHTSSLVNRFGHGFDDFSHVSIAGGAFVRFLSGEELPGIEVL